MGIFSSTPTTAKFLRPATEGIVVEMNIINPTASELGYVRIQKMDLDAKLGKQTRKDIKPNYREIFQRPPLDVGNLTAELRRGPHPLQLIKQDRLPVPPSDPVVASCVTRSYYDFWGDHAPV